MSGLVEIQLLNGIVQGMIYALVAAGLTLIFGMLDIPNFAHGAFYALGAYVAYTVVSATGNFWLAIAIVPLVIAVLGLAVDAFAMRRLARAGHVYQILFTLGLVLIVQEAIVLLWGANPTSVNVPAALDGGFPLGAVSFPYYRLFLVGASALVVGGEEGGGVDVEREKVADGVLVFCAGEAADGIGSARRGVLGGGVWEIQYETQPEIASTRVKTLG